MPQDRDIIILLRQTNFLSSEETELLVASLQVLAPADVSSLHDALLQAQKESADIDTKNTQHRSTFLQEYEEHLKHGRIRIIKQTEQTDRLFEEQAYGPLFHRTNET